MKPEEAAEVVFSIDRQQFAKLRSRLGDAVRKRQARRVVFVNYVLSKLRESKMWPTSPSIDSIPHVAFRWVSVALALDVMCGVRKGVSLALRGDMEELENLFSKCLETVDAVGPSPEFISNAVAHAVAGAVVSKALSHRPLVQTGRMMFVYGRRGSGKTTLTFWSLLRVLLDLGIEYKVAVEVVKALWAHNIEEYVDLLTVASDLARRGKSLPFVVVEDAGVTLSKYMILPMAGRQSFELAKTVVELEQISREGVCASIYLASPSSVLKGIREATDMATGGVFIDVPPLRYTVWVSRLGRTVVDVFSTVHPVLHVPDSVFSEWLEQKLSTRERLIGSVKDIVSGSSQSGEREVEDV